MIICIYIESSGMTNENRKRSDDGTYTETVTPKDVLAILTDKEPRTATEVADKLGIARRTALNKLDKLAADDQIRRKKVGGRAVIWWVPYKDNQPDRDTSG